jgi:hypothetical protein
MELSSRFTSTGLTIREKRAVISHKYFTQHGFNDFLVDHRLVGCKAKDAVEWICPGVRGSRDTKDSLWRRRLDNHL